MSHQQQTPVPPPSSTMSRRRRFSVDVEGVRMPRFFSEECFRSALRFRPKPGDLFVATYPKCGTTWMQYLVLNILRRGESFDRPVDFHLASPFLDMLGAEDAENMMIRPGAYKTHLPLQKTPWSEKAKYIYVARNPKDCCASFYHHVRELPAYDSADLTFDEFLEAFLSGEIEFGSYFDHVIPWYEKRREPNVFFTTYERMKSDFPRVAMEVAEFIDGKEADHLRRHPDVLEKILHNCSFGEMKMVNEGLSAMYNCRDPSEFEKLPKGRRHVVKHIQSRQRAVPKRDVNFIRRGQVGAWNSEMTPVHVEAINKEIEAKTKDSDVMSLWREDA